MIVYICIGNSDDKLSQARWARFIGEVDRLLTGCAVHGRWFAAPDVAWQSACWCVEFAPDLIVDNSPDYLAVDGSRQIHAEMSRTQVNYLQRELARLTGRYGQDSIAWAQTPYTELIRPPLPRSEP